MEDALFWLLCGASLGILLRDEFAKWRNRKKPDGEVVKIQTLIPMKGGFITWNGPDDKPNMRCEIVKHLWFGRVRVIWRKP